MKKPLTALTLSALQQKSKPYYVSDSKQDGLRVRVAPSGLLTWNVAYRIRSGGPTSVSLGRCDPSGRDGLDLSAARDRAAAILKAARDGRDLLAEERTERRAAKDALTVEGLIASYAKHIASPNRRGGALRTAREIERRLKRALLTKLNAPADDVTRADISRLLDDVAERYPREAERRRQVIHAMYRWATGKGYATTNPLVGTPSYGTGATRDRVFSANEIRIFWQWLDGGAEAMPPDVVAVLRLQLLLGARAGEIAGMEASELVPQDKQLLWMLPASRAKNKKAHTRPLVGKARAIVESAMTARKQGPLFRTLDGKRALTSTDIGQALNNRERPVEHFTTHDLRRTVVSSMDELGIALDTVAAVVGHQRGTAATRTLIRHYSRPNLDSRVEAALATWDAHVQAIVANKEPVGNVVRIAG